MIYLFIAGGFCILFLIGFTVTTCRRIYFAILRYNCRNRRATMVQELANLRIYQWRDSLNSNDTCAICRETFIARDELRICPCTHGYHVYCIDNWIQSGSLYCPLCMRGIIPNAERYTSSDILNVTGDEQTPLLMPSTYQTRHDSIGEHYLHPLAHGPPSPKLRKVAARADLSKEGQGCSVTPLNFAAESGNQDPDLKRAPKKTVKSVSSSSSNASLVLTSRGILENFPTPNATVVDLEDPPGVKPGQSSFPKVSVTDVLSVDVENVDPPY